MTVGEHIFNILIVDDTVKNIQIAANILKKHNHNIIFALDGEKALQIIKNGGIDLVLLDIMMPGMDGFTACRLIKADLSCRDIPIIFLTAKNDNESIVRGFEEGAVDFVTKPFNGAELLARVGTHLRLSGMQQDLMREVDERTKALKALSESQKRYSAIVESQVDLVVRTNIDGEFTFVNNAYCEKVGRSKGDLIGRSVLPLIHEDDVERSLEFEKDLYEAPYRVRFEQRILSDGKWCWVQWEKYAVHDDDGNIVEIQSVGRDITNQKDIENALIESERKLNEANKAKDKFFSIIAHDLRNPIGGLRSLTKLLSEDYETFDEKEFRVFIDMAFQSSKTVYNLLEDLLKWARSQSNLIKFEPRELDLMLMVEKNMAIMQPLAINKGIELISHIPYNTLITVDDDMITTVFRNLLSNAIKFTYSGGRIEISADESDELEGYIEVSVKDSGIGIMKEDMDKLFRIDISHSLEGTKGESGTGLGLILCNEFINRHGGRIWVESEISSGSTFKFLIPGIMSGF